MSQDMVASYVETMLERLLGLEKVVADSDGDHPVRFKDALYYVRVAGTSERPVVRIFSVVVSEIDPSGELYELINEINAQLQFCRCFWVRGQVLIEDEHLGLTIRPDDFNAIVSEVARAADYFGPVIHAAHGGRLAFEEAKGEDAETPPPAADSPGLYL